MMHLVNNIGRNVMQGAQDGQRCMRHLHWKHGDINEFLEMKNWDEMPVGDTTVAALKEADFQLPSTQWI